MKFGYVGNQFQYAVINHTRGVKLNDTGEVDATIMENSMVPPEQGGLAINTSDAVRAIGSDESLGRKFNTVYGIESSDPVTYLYGFVAPAGTSEFIEMSYSTSFMTGNVGPSLGIVKATGMHVEDPQLAIPGMTALLEGLQAMEYAGEITIGITADYKICRVLFGTFIGGFCLFNELAKAPMQDYYAFAAGGPEPKGLYRKGVAILNLISLPPFPAIIMQATPEILYPPDAEKHLYRIKYGHTEIAYVCTWGRDIMEAKRRGRLTLENCTRSNADLQYRVDYGHKEQFVISTDRWLQFGGSLPHPR